MFHCSGRVVARAANVSLVAAASLLAAGCGVTSTQMANPAAVASMSGIVHGGPNPVVGATVRLYATTSGGYGATASLLSTTVTLANGSFVFTSAATCPAGQEAYAVANGGNPGSGLNTSYVLMAALGPCSTISSSTSIFINEASTVAAAYALRNFMTVGGTAALPQVNVGAPAANNGYPTGTCTNTGSTVTSCTAAGLYHAFENALNLVNSVSVNGVAPNGLAYTAAPSNPNSVVPTALINSLANAIEACVNSGGGTAGDGTVCGNLFTYTTPPYTGAAAPTNTLQALMNLAKYPAMTPANVTNIYNLATPVAFYAPALTPSAPPDWSLGVVFSSVTVGGTTTAVGPAYNLTFDANDNVYVSAANSTQSYALAFGSNGASLWASAPNTTDLTYRVIASDTLGHVWVVQNGGTVAKAALVAYNTVDGSQFMRIGNIAKSPFGLAFDKQNNLWFGTSTASVANLFEYTQTSGYTTLASFPVQPAYTGAGPQYIAIDANQNIWSIGSATANAPFQVFPNTGTVAAPTYTSGPLTLLTSGANNSGIALDANGDAWSAGSTGVSETTATYGASPSVAVTALSTAVYPSSATLVLPKFLSVDGAGVVWTPDQTASTITEYIPSQTLTATLAPCYTPAAAQTCSNALGAVKRTQVDSTGSVWIDGGGFGVTQLIGSGAPTWPQLSLGQPGVMPQ